MSRAHTNLKNKIIKEAAPDTMLLPYDSGMFMTMSGNPIRLGQKGVLDTVGYTMLRITPEMVGMKLPIFTSIDAKVGKDRIRKEQGDFIARINRLGGYAGAVQQIEDIDKILRKGVAKTRLDV